MTKILGNHSLKAGVAFQNIRFAYLQPRYVRGYYDYTGLYTSSPAASITSGYGVADFLVNQMNNTTITNADQYRRSGMV